MDVSFNSGLSGISRIGSDVLDQNYPRDNSSFKPSGDSITAHFWEALDMGKTFQSREKRFAISINEQEPSLSPDEHHMMTDMALNILEKHINVGPEIKKALEVLQESKELQKYLMMTRNVLVAG